MQTDLFIDGRYVAPAGGGRVGDNGAATGEVVGGGGGAGAAVSAARAAADHGPWPRLGAEARAKIIDRFADGIERRARALGELEARDVGKPVVECVQHDVARAAKNLRFFAAAAQTWTQE